MKQLLFFCLLCLCFFGAAHAQGTTQYPASLDTTTTLPQAVDNKFTYLTAAATSSATTLTVNSTAGVPASGVLQVDSELMSYVVTNSTTCTVTRAFSNTTAVPHSANAGVRFPLTSAHINGTNGAVIALQTKLGTDGTGGTTSPTNVGEVLTVTAAGKTAYKPASASGESNTASNVGTVGVGVFKQKSGVDLQFKKLNATSSKVTITDDTANSKIDLDVSQSNLDRNALGGGVLSVTNGGTGAGNAASARANLGAEAGLTFASPISRSTNTISIPAASGSQNGYLTSTDWMTFNNKFVLPALTSGSVLFSNGTTIAQNNSNLFWDDTNKRLGVGYSGTLGAGLVVTHGTGPVLQMRNRLNDDSRLGNILTYVAGPTRNAVIFKDDANSFTFGDSSINLISAQSIQATGITHLNGSFNTFKVSYYNNGFNEAFQLNNSFGTANGEGVAYGIALADSGGAQRVVTKFGGIWIDRTNTNYKGAFVVYTNNNGTLAERLRIDNAGNVAVNGFTAATIGLTVKGAASQTANLQEWQNSSGTPLTGVDPSGNFKLPHLYGNSATPTCAIGTASGTGATCTITGNDLGGQVAYTTGTSAGLSGQLFTLTFATTYTSAPYPVLTAANLNASGKSIYTNNVSATAFDLNLSTGLSSSTTYIWNYHVVR